MMKKFLFFMLAAALFCGCDKDDAPCPVAEVNIPASSAENPVQPGSPVTIQGKGFTDASEIWLRGTGRAAEVRVEITAVSATSLTFTAPDVSGKQNVILKQDGGEWNLGKLYFPEAPDEGGEIAILPKKLVKVEMTVQDEEYTETYTTEYTYDESGRLLQIKRSDEYSQDVSEIEYTTNEIIIRDLSYDKDRTTFRLENGRAATCVAEESNYKCETEFSYGSNGYLSGFVNKATWEDGTDSYKGTLTIGDGGYLKTYDVKEVKLEAGNYTLYTIDFTPNKNVRNNLNLDLMGSDEFMELIDEQAIGYAYLLGIGGKRTTYLPEKFTIYGEDEEEGKFKFTVKYKYEFIGDYISKIIIDDSENGNYITLKLYYEE